MSRIWPGPLIGPWVKEMHRGRTVDLLAVNVGSNDWNFQVKDLAEAVASVLPGLKVSINTDAMPDKRSRVNFDLFKKLAPNHQPQCTLVEAIRGIERWPPGHGIHRHPFQGVRFNQTESAQSAAV